MDLGLSLQSTPDAQQYAGGQGELNLEGCWGTMDCGLTTMISSMPAVIAVCWYGKLN